MSNTLTKKTKGKIAYLTIGFALCVLVLGGSRAVVKATEDAGVESPEDLVLRAVASYVIDHGDGVVAGKLLDTLLARKEERMGVISNESNRSPVDRVCYKYPNGIRCVAEGWSTLDYLGASTATTTVSEANRLSVPFVIDYAEIITTGYVTSTFAVSMGTSTSQYGPVSNASSSNAAYPDGIIQRSIIASSSLTLASMRRIEMEGGNRGFIVATSSRGIMTPTQDQFGPSGGARWVVPTSTFVMLFLQDESNPEDVTNGFCPEDGNTCTTVTSTANQMNVSARYKYHYEVNL
jgi:hypothetical protein